MLDKSRNVVNHFIMIDKGAASCHLQWSGCFTMPVFLPLYWKRWIEVEIANNYVDIMLMLLYDGLNQG